MNKEYGYIVVNYNGIRYVSDIDELSETKENIAKIMRGEDVSFSMKYQNKRHFFPAEVIRKAVITINYTDKAEKINTNNLIGSII